MRKSAIFLLVSSVILLKSRIADGKKDDNDEEKQLEIYETELPTDDSWFLAEAKKDTFFKTFIKMASRALASFINSIEAIKVVNTVPDPTHPTRRLLQIKLGYFGFRVLYDNRPPPKIIKMYFDPPGTIPDLTQF